MPSERSDLLARLNEKHSRLTAMAASGGSEEITELMAELADLTARLLAADEKLNRAEDRAAHLERALSSNRQIGTAMGILMARLQLTDEQAFDLLRRTSQNRNRKLHELADEVILTGELPQPHE